MRERKIILITLSIIISLIAISVLTFFLFKEVNDIYEYAKKYKKKVDYLEDRLNILEGRLNILEFERKITQLDNNIINYNEVKLEINYLSLPNIIDELYKPIGYLDIIEDNLIFVTGDGQINLLKDQNFFKVGSNLRSFINNKIKSDDNTNSFWLNPIRDILYHDGYLYVVLFLKEYQNKALYQTAILKGKLENNFINFNYFFKADEYAYNDFIDTTHVGGRLAFDQNNNFYLAVPDYGSPYENNVDKFKGVYGKIIKINSKKDYEIISTGHRNPQGLYYDIIKNFLIESEHGPSGGDEINIIRKNKNYGWPSTSYGDGAYVEYNDHLSQGFEPPAYTWNDNPGVSQLIKIPNNSRFPFNNKYILSSLSGSIRGPDEYSGYHLYIFDINKNLQANIIDRIFINDRVRDIIYDNKKDHIYLLLENQKSIGIISIKN